MCEGATLSSTITHQLFEKYPTKLSEKYRGNGSLPTQQPTAHSSDKLHRITCCETSKGLHRVTMIWQDSPECPDAQGPAQRPSARRASSPVSRRHRPVGHLFVLHRASYQQTLRCRKLHDCSNLVTQRMSSLDTVSSYLPSSRTYQLPSLCLSKYTVLFGFVRSSAESGSTTGSHWTTL